MADMYELQRRWRAFSADRAKAKRELQEQDDADKAEIARLQEQIIARNSEFDEKWRNRKADLQRKRDEAVMAELAIPGRSAQGILKDLGSNNTVWIYDLRAKVMAATPIAAPENVNTRTHVAGEAHPMTAPMKFIEPTVPLTELQEENEKQIQALISGAHWNFARHPGVVGWLLSDDYTLVKRYGAEKTEFEDQWFVAERASKTFLSGSRELFDATPKGEITRRTKMLESILEGTYTTPFKEVENSYTS